MNIENNIQLDCMSMPLKEVTDMKISYKQKFLLLSAI